MAKQKVATTRDLEREIAAAKLLTDQLKDLADPELTRDTIEGSTSLPEMVDAMVWADGVDESHVVGLDAYIKELQSRKERIKARMETRRTLLCTALEVSGQDRFDTSTGVITRRLAPVRCIVTEEADIPARFFIPQPPKLSLKDVGDALKARAKAIEALASLSPEAQAIERAYVDRDYPDVPGATLSNQAYTVSIRR